jgi:hypothetical protein
MVEMLEGMVHNFFAQMQELWPEEVLPIEQLPCPLHDFQGSVDLKNLQEE